MIRTFSLVWAHGRQWPAITKHWAAVKKTRGLLLWKMPLKVAAIVKYAENVNYALAFAAAVDDEMRKAFRGVADGDSSASFSSHALRVRPCNAAFAFSAAI